MEMKKKFFILAAVLLFLAAFQLYSKYAAYAKDKYLKYLPQNQFVDMVSKDVNKTVSEVICSYTTNLFKKVKECEACINAQATCPDCWLTNAKPAIACTPSAGAQGVAAAWHRYRKQRMQQARSRSQGLYSRVPAVCRLQIMLLAAPQRGHCTSSD